VRYTYIYLMWALLPDEYVHFFLCPGNEFSLLSLSLCESHDKAGLYLDATKFRFSFLNSLTIMNMSHLGQVTNAWTVQGGPLEALEKMHTILHYLGAIQNECFVTVDQVECFAKCPAATALQRTRIRSGSRRSKGRKLCVIL
jgi:hypothetical protein